jgi:hypothetical protein
MFAAMRLIAFIAAALTLTACASTPPASTPVSNEAAMHPSYPSLAAQLLASAGRADAPSRAEIERAFGAPDIARQDGAGAALTYRLDTCALLLVLTTDARNELRLAEAHASARTNGAPTPTLETCAAEADARR